MSYFDFYGAAKPYLRDYVESITERSKSGLYCCPLPECNSGHGPKKSGAFSITKDGQRWRCFSCGNGGDIWDLVEGVTGKKSEEAAEYLAGLFPGIRSGQLPKDYNPPKKETSAEPVKPNIPGLYTAFIAACAANVGKTNYWTRRGFTPETVARFRLGYDPQTAGAIIPYDATDAYYISRSTTGKAFYKPKTDEAGPEPVFNTPALYSGVPCFICEAPIDAISICQAGGEAAATGGTAHNNLIEQIKLFPPVAPLIICYDPDEPGKKAAEKLAGELTALKIPFINGTELINRQSYQNGDALKDPNDLLRADPGKLAADVKRIMEAASAAPETGQTFHTAAEYLKLQYDNDIRYFAAYKDRKTGFINLDRYFTLYPGLCAIGGAASLGKTSFCVNLAENLARAGETVLYFALEQSAVELTTKILARNLYRLHPETPFTNLDIKNGVSAPAIMEARQSVAEFMQRVFIINGDFNTTVKLIENIVKAFIEQTNKKPVVFIDYLQLIAPVDVKADTRTQTDFNIKALKKLQRDNELFVFLISNFNRSSYGEPVSYEAFKESGMIEYTCDYVFGLQMAILEDPRYWRVDGIGKLHDEITKRKKMEEEQKKKPKDVELVSLKNRNGEQRFNAFFHYWPQWDTFEPCEYTVLPWDSTLPAEETATGSGVDPETASALDAVRAEKKKAKGTKKT